MGLRGTAFRLLVAGGVGVSLVFATALPTAADDISDALARLQTINKLKGDLRNNLQKAQAQEIALLQQLQETRDTINQTMDKIAATERRIAALERQIAALDAQIAEEQLELRRTKGQYAIFVRSVYKSEEHTSELQSQSNLVCRLLLEKKKNKDHKVDSSVKDVQQVS